MADHRLSPRTGIAVGMRGKERLFVLGSRLREPMVVPLLHARIDNVYMIGLLLCKVCATMLLLQCTNLKSTSLTNTYPSTHSTNAFRQCKGIQRSC